MNNTLVAAIVGAALLGSSVPGGNTVPNGTEAAQAAVSGDGASALSAPGNGVWGTPVRRKHFWGWPRAVNPYFQLDGIGRPAAGANAAVATAAGSAAVPPDANDLARQNAMRDGAMACVIATPCAAALLAVYAGVPGLH